MSYTPTLGLKVAKTAEFVEEASFGTFPTNPTMQWIGTNLQYSHSADMGAIEVRNLGSEDLKTVLKGADNYEVDLSYEIQNSTFLKYLVNAQGGGSGSIDKSLSLLIAPQINGITEFLEIIGTRPGSGSIKWQLGKEISASVKLFAQAILAYSQADPVSLGSHASDPGTNPWIFTDPGASGITVGGVAYDVQELTVNFNRNLQRIRAIGQSTAKYIIPAVRDITFDLTILLESTSPFSGLLNSTMQTIVAPLKNGVSTLTLTNCFFKKVGQTIHVKDFLVEKYSGVAESTSLT